jgi:hypothetical protein
MKAQPTPPSGRAFLIVAAACLLAGCTMMRQMSAQREAKQRTEQLQELQLDVMRFADEYRNRVGEVASRFHIEDVAASPGGVEVQAAAQEIIARCYAERPSKRDRPVSVTMARQSVLCVVQPPVSKPG